MFESNWIVSDNPLMGDGKIILSINVSAVPVPAAVWLFGTALIGFVGMSRRTSIKT
ncbi:MAG: VPLPA-CTERM sorting domain-containing protein [Gammaproteobacteria bacterium]|nr:VPLPA-CTERM sorting domain-containing protein [Gammaproteobacteria bacterium]